MISARVLTAALVAVGVSLVQGSGHSGRLAPATREMAEFLKTQADAAGQAIASLPEPDLFQLTRATKDPALRRQLERLADLQIALARGDLETAVPALARLVDDPAFLEAAPGEARAIALRLLGGAALRQADRAFSEAGAPSPSLLGHPRQAIPPAARAPLDLARHTFERLLALTPDDAGAQWLLNASHVLAGTYPAGVPDPWRLTWPAEAAAGIAPFRNVARDAGLAAIGRAGGVITEDFDNDGLIDIIVSSAGLSPKDQLRYYHNDGSGRFSDRTDAAGLTGLTGGLNIASADYDNDGLVDLFVPRGAWLRDAGRQPPSLLRNRGGWFEDVTEKAGIVTFAPAHAVAWGDFDNDGWLDLFVGNETTPVDAAPNPSYLFHNNHDGTFRDVAAQVGADAVGWIKGAVWGDIDNDGLPDLYISRLMGGGILLRNNGAAKGFRFTDITARAGVGAPENQYVCWFFDYDNDGALDLFVASTSSGRFWADAANVAALFRGDPGRGDRLRLFRNRGDGTFANVTTDVGLNQAISAMGGNYGDFDGDGWPDIYIGTGNPMYYGLMPDLAWRNLGGQHYANVTMAGGFGHLQKGHGIAFADLDGDGDEDVVAVKGGVYAGDMNERIVLENMSPPHRWITLRLRGTASNRSAIGARLRLTVATPAGTRMIHGVVSTGGSFGASSLQQEIGLGDATRIRELAIRWPSGATQQFTDVPLDTVISVTERGPMLRVPVQRLTLGTPVTMSEGSR